MMKKVALLVLFAAFVIVLVAGAVNRTMARADMTAGGQGRGQESGEGHGQGEGSGHGQGQGESLGNGLGLADGSSESRVSEWLTVEGVVVSVADAEMIFRVGAGSDIMVEGRPWQFAAEQGFTPEVGDEVTVVGFYEDGEFKAGRIDDTARGQSVTLRDQDGRPGWSGQGRRQQEASPGN